MERNKSETISSKESLLERSGHGKNTNDVYRQEMVNFQNKKRDGIKSKFDKGKIEIDGNKKKEFQRTSKIRDSSEYKEISESLTRQKQFFLQEWKLYWSKSELEGIQKNSRRKSGLEMPDMWNKKRSMRSSQEPRPNGQQNREFNDSMQTLSYEITFIKLLEKEEVMYDLYVPETSNFILENGVISHNSGKSMATELIVNRLWKAGYTIIIVTDFKDNMEYAHSMFKPREKWHLKTLERVGIIPEGIPTKIYHPFTLAFPYKKRLFDMNLFTFDIRELGSEELSVLAETNRETDSMRMMLDTLSHLSRNESIYDFFYRIEKKILSRKKNYSGTDIYQPDWENFGLDTPTKANRQTLGEISDYLKPFQHHYMITSSDCKLNLKPEEILNDQKHYHHLITRFMPQQRMKEKGWVQFTFFKQLVRNLHKAKYPVCFVLQEIGQYCPRTPEGYQENMANSFRSDILTVRNKGRGVTTVLNTQVIKEVDERISNDSTEVLIGKVGSIKETEAVGKAMSYPRRIIEQLQQLETGRFILKGKEDVGALRFPPPPHCHKESYYNFDEMYAEEFPDKLKTYEDEYKYMLDLKNEQFDRVKKRKMKIKDAEIKVAEDKKKREDRERKLRDDKERLQEENKEAKKEKFDERDNRIYQYYLEHKDDPEPTSYKKIGEEFGLDKQNTYRIINKMKSISKTQDNKIDTPEV